MRVTLRHVSAFLLMGWLVVLLAGCGVADRVGKRFDDTWAGDLFGNSERVRVTIDSDSALNPDVDGEPWMSGYMCPFDLIPVYLQLFCRRFLPM